MPGGRFLLPPEPEGAQGWAVQGLVVLDWAVRGWAAQSTIMAHLRHQL